MIPGANFFANMVFEQPWSFFISRDDYRLLAVEFEPPPQYAQVILEGVRYTILSTKEVDGVRIPNSIMMEGFNLDSRDPNGHIRTTNLTIEVVEVPDFTIFYDPLQMQKLEEGDD
jgi:hypothetical protein